MAHHRGVSCPRLRLADRYDHDCLTASYRSIPITTIDMAASDDFCSPGFHHFLGHFLVLASLLQQGQLPRHLPLVKVLSFKRAPTYVMAVIAAGDSHYPTTFSSLFGHFLAITNQTPPTITSDVSSCRRLYFETTLEPCHGRDCRR